MKGDTILNFKTHIFWGHYISNENGIRLLKKLRLQVWWLMASLQESFNITLPNHHGSAENCNHPMLHAHKKWLKLELRVGSRIFFGGLWNIYIYTWNPLMTLLLVRRGLVLRGWPSKIEVIWVPGIYTKYCQPKHWSIIRANLWRSPSKSTLKPAHSARPLGFLGKTCELNVLWNSSSLVPAISRLTIQILLVFPFQLPSLKLT